MHGSGSAVSSNINVLNETFQCDRSTVWTRPSVFNTVIVHGRFTTLAKLFIWPFQNLTLFQSGLAVSKPN